jgi:hypothetical protein
MHGCAMMMRMVQFDRRDCVIGSGSDDALELL